MAKSLRTLEILDFLKERRRCSIGELIARFEVSPATMHRDLTALTQRKLIEKMHGGVAVVSGPEDSSGLVSSYHARIHLETRRKEKAAAVAAGWVSEGDVLFLDSSTTVLHLARKLRELAVHNLTIVTNSVSIIQDFCRFPADFVMVALGGSYHGGLNALLGKAAFDQLAGVRIGKAFVSSVGVSPEGAVTSYHEEHAAFLTAVLARSEKAFLVVDSTKFGRSGLYQFAGPGSFDGLASDAPPPRAITARLKLRTFVSKAGGTKIRK